MTFKVIHVRWFPSYLSCCICCPTNVSVTHSAPVTREGARLASGSTPVLGLLPLPGTLLLWCLHGSVPHCLPVISSRKPSLVTLFVIRFTPTKTTHSWFLIYFSPLHISAYSVYFTSSIFFYSLSHSRIVISRRAEILFHGFLFFALIEYLIHVVISIQ